MQKIENIPHFKEIDVTQIEMSLQKILAENLCQIDMITSQNNFTWNNLVEPLMLLDNALQTFWSPIAHLHSVADTPELRQVYDSCIGKITEYETQIWQNKMLFLAFDSILSDQEYSLLAFPAQKVITNAIRDFKLSGVHLEKDKKNHFMMLQKRLNELETHFGNHVLDAHQAWHKPILTEENLAGVPAHAKQAAKEQAKLKNQAGYLLTLDQPCYHAIITYADDAELRKEIYTAYVTSASELGEHPEKWDNSELIVNILATRHEMATLLGFNNYAEYSLANKMANSTEEVLHFLKDLSTRAKQQAHQEFTDLTAFAKRTAGLSELNPWDIAYYSEKLRKQLFDVCQEDLRPYFPLTKVIQGLFSLTSDLFNISFIEIPCDDTWHPDVRCYHILDQDGTLRGRFYTDLYARRQKRSGAWMDHYCSRLKLANGDIQIPVAYLNCNFSAPLDDHPALLTHEEVETLFHEFGHGIHHMLTQIDASYVSGINGVSWDAVELPSQFMENFCWDKTILNRICAHYITHEPLPDELFEKMINAKHFQAGMQIVRQLEFALFDFNIHLSAKPNVQQILNAVRANVAVTPIAPFNRFQHSFTHIFAGSYAAGYYSYLWAEVLSSDAFSKFEEEGVTNPETGLAFLHHILEMGGAKDAMDLFVAFRGRKPTIDALLRHRGLLT